MATYTTHQGFRCTSIITLKIDEFDEFILYDVDCIK